MSDRNQDSLDLGGTVAGPVECLGMTFESETARREHFAKLLREKLQDPAFRRISGFPRGSDEDILRMSDPPYYTACPNPWLRDFVNPEEPSGWTAPAPLAQDVSGSKSGAIYGAHSYHTKVPHEIVQRFIEHYTEPGDVVLDCFAGTGMTGVAAQLSGRQAILIELSPAASFLSYNFNSRATVREFDSAVSEVEQVLDRLRQDYRFTSGGYRSFTIYSDIVECSTCTTLFPQWSASFDEATEDVSAKFSCPGCATELTSKTVTRMQTRTYDPILQREISIRNKRQVFARLKDGSVRDVELDEPGNAYPAELVDHSASIPVIELPRMFESHVKRNLGADGITHFHHLYTPRNLLMTTKLWEAVRDGHPLLRFAFLNTSWHATLMRRYNARGGHRPKTNTLYVPAFTSEACVPDVYAKKLRDLRRFVSAKSSASTTSVISTQSATDLFQLSNDSVDYVFIDPPFGSNIMYSDLNLLWEGWLGVRTDTAPEAIENEVQGKTLRDYEDLMTASLRECHRVLKPGRWLTMEFHNSSNAVWNAISQALWRAGFVVADVRTLSKGHGSITQYTSKVSVRDDLVISAYKPGSGGGEGALGHSTDNDAWDFVREFLAHLPVLVKNEGGDLLRIPERQDYLLFDRMVSFFVERGRSVPLSSGAFYAGLAQRLPSRDAMFFLESQVAEYDRARMRSDVVTQASLFVTDEESAIRWLREELRDRPRSFSGVQPDFMREMRSWEEHESRIELHSLLEQNFLRYEGVGPVPSQIHSYLSTNFASLRNRDKTDGELRAKAADRWYVPDPAKEEDIQKLRSRTLLKQFEEYRSSSSKRLKEFRTEAVRAGFKDAYDRGDYSSIVAVAEKLPDSVLQEDEKLLMYYDVARMRTGSMD